jgi:DDE superfamily endonuclease
MSLLSTFESLLEPWREIFPQSRTFERSRRLMFGTLFCLRIHLTSNAICAAGLQFQDWSADYKVFSRSPWDPHRLFDPIFANLAPFLPAAQSPVFAAIDDTMCKKTGRKIPGASTGRDPQSLPFHVNLIRGLRFVQVSLLVSPLDQPGPARALPVRFEPAPPAAKPKKNASEDEKKLFREEKKKRALTRVGVNMMTSVRDQLDQRPDTANRQLIMSGDGSYTNGSVLKKLPPRTTFIGRIRKDAKLFLPLPEPGESKSSGRPRRYGLPAPTPEQVLKDESIPPQKVFAFAAGQMREFSLKIVKPLYWRKAGSDMPLMLVVIKPVGYRLRNGSKLLYRDPAFLICTDLTLAIETFLQAYIDRWQIECNHRDEKSFIGVAQGQVRNPQAVARLPQFQVAGYSLLVLASLITFGFQRSAEFLPLPKWRGKSIRPSVLDILNLLRQQIFSRQMQPVPDNENSFDHFAEIHPIDAKSMKLAYTPESLSTYAA